MRKKIFSIAFLVAFVFLLASIFSNYQPVFSNSDNEYKEDVDYNYYSERERKVLEVRFRDQFYILDENITKEYINKFNADSESKNHTVRLFYEQVVGILVPQDEREAMFINQLTNQLKLGATTLVPATFENTRKSLLATIEHHNLNPNPELDEDLKNSWSEGSIRNIRQDFTPLSRTSQDAILNSHYGRIRLNKGIEVELIDWALLSTSPTTHNPYFSERLWEYVKVLNGEHEGKIGWVLHYFLD